MESSVGFFANRNHYAALLYCLIPILTAWIAAAINEEGGRNLPGIAVCVISYAVLLLGLGMAGSRAGMTLALGAAIAGLFIAGGSAARGKSAIALSIAGLALALGIVLVFEYALFGLLGRFASDPLADYRFVIGRTAFAAASAVQPLGAGFGTFVPVYQLFEHRDALIPNYVNRAHDDWLEIWLEGGFVALATAAAFVSWFLFQTWSAWRGKLMASRSSIDQALPRAATVVIALLMLHSIVDYPLRTTALSTVFAFCCALLVPPINGEDRRPSGGSGQSAGASRPARRSRFRASRAA